jgi:Protein of unknown function (DUF2946)
MQRNFASHHPLRRSALWRGAVGCVVAYSLVITALLSGVLQAEWFAQAAAGLIGEHCVTDARAAGADPSAPAGQPDDSSHCALCTLAAGPAALPVAPVTAFIVPPRAIAPAGVSDHGVILWSGHPGKLPRGPPQSVVEA